jgi:hypothetical protein
MMSAVLLCGCMRQAGHNVLEVILIKGERKPDGDMHSQTIVFRRDGAAERNTFIRNPGNVTPSSTEERGTFSTDSFERVAKTIEENNFFSKKEKKSDPDADGEFINLAVSSKDGSNEISNDIEVDPKDPQIQNIIAAIEKEAGQINWQSAK